MGNSGAFNVRQTDGVITSVQTVTSLDAGSKILLKFPIKFHGCGLYGGKITVDVDDHIRESDESNNGKEWQMKISAFC